MFLSRKYIDNILSTLVVMANFLILFLLLRRISLHDVSVNVAYSLNMHPLYMLFCMHCSKEITVILFHEMRIILSRN